MPCIMKPVLSGACVLVALLGANAALLKTSATMKDGPMFTVSADFDWKNHDPAKGVSIAMSTDSGMLSMKSGIKTTGKDIAWGYMKDELSKDGWIKLYLQTAETTSVTNDVQMYAAGYIEGMLTAQRISQFYSNFYQTIIKNTETAQALDILKKVFHDELEFVKTNGNFHPGVGSTVEPVDPYWKHMRYQFHQLWGIKDGYNFVALAKGVRQLTMIDMMIINSHAELPELLQAYTPKALASRTAFQQMVHEEDETGKKASFLQKSVGSMSMTGLHKNATAEEVDRDWENRLIRRGRCSALVRVTPENKDIMVGHTTWGDYGKMTRIFKYYHFVLKGAHTAATHIGFSSYPGCISSTDDFYELNSGLVVMDTSLEILNGELYNRVADFPTNSHVPDWMHVMTVNRMAKTAPHWAALFSESNSGTDNAQWSIVDYNRFEPGRPIKDGTFWVLEQVPGMMFRKDMSFYLRDNGYFASYNRPYFDKIRDVSGHTHAEQQHGDLYTWGKGPRATIFSGAAPLVSVLMDMRGVMNRNMWPNEGVLPSEPGHAISARMDLAFGNIPNGGIDAKVVGRCLLRSMQCQAISGPTHTNQPVFKWMDGAAEMMKGWPHLGLPDVFDFSWVQMTPTASLKHLVDIDDC